MFPNSPFFRFGMASTIAAIVSEALHMLHWIRVSGLSESLALTGATLLIAAAVEAWTYKPPRNKNGGTL